MAALILVWSSPSEKGFDTTALTPASRAVFICDFSKDDCIIKGIFLGTRDIFGNSIFLEDENMFIEPISDESRALLNKIYEKIWSGVSDKYENK